MAVLVCIWLFNVSLLLNVALGFYDTYFFKVFAVQVLLKYAFELVFLYPIAAFFKRTKLVALLILVIPVHVIYLIYIGFIGNSGAYHWKGRMVR